MAQPQTIPFPLGLMLAAWLAILTAGCEQGPSATVQGKVSLDGQPLADGSITFIPTDKQSQTAGAVIQNGAYSVAMEPGPKQVRITATRVVGQEPAYAGDPNSPMRDITKTIVDVEETREIQAGPNTHDFELTSSKQGR